MTQDTCSWAARWDTLPLGAAVFQGQGSGITAELIDPRFIDTKLEDDYGFSGGVL